MVSLFCLWWVCLLWTGTTAPLSAGWEQVFIIHLLLVPTDASVTPPSTLCLKWAARRLCALENEDAY